MIESLPSIDLSADRTHHIPQLCWHPSYRTVRVQSLIRIKISNVQCAMCNVQWALFPAPLESTIEYATRQRSSLAATESARSSRRDFRIRTEKWLKRDELLLKAIVTVPRISYQPGLILGISMQGCNMEVTVAGTNALCFGDEDGDYLLTLIATRLYHRAIARKPYTSCTLSQSKCSDWTGVDGFLSQIGGQIKALVIQS